METPRVCLGCFSEWEQDAGECSRCGWEPGKRYTDMFRWNSGTVLDGRYLLGRTFCRVRDIAVWWIYDNLLKSPCFVLRRSGNERKELLPLAQRLEFYGKSNGGAVKVLALKTIDEKNVLIFSMKDRYMDGEAFKAILLSEPEGDCSMEEREEASESFGKKEQVLPEGESLGGQYRVKECVGIGGFGIIYHCEDKFLCRSVAVKEYFPQEWAERDGQYVAVRSSGMVEAYRYGMKSFLKEAEITAKFIHTDHVVTIYDVIETNDTVYLVMEYLSGISVGRRMRARDYKPYTPEQAAEIILPVLEGLEEMHNNQIVHSDISPGNIMWSEEGKAALIDMGAAKYSLESQPPLSAAFLKIDYSAPEQYRTAKEGVPKDEGPWTDVYGVGATMYYMLTGHKPTDVITRLSSKKSDLISPRKYKVKLPRQWADVLRRATALDREERISSASELKHEILKLLK